LFADTHTGSNVYYTFALFHDKKKRMKKKKTLKPGVSTPPFTLFFSPLNKLTVPDTHKSPKPYYI
jgi:hypothetical protein